MQNTFAQYAGNTHRTSGRLSILRPSQLLGALLLSTSALVSLPASADQYVECKSLDRNWTDEDCWHDRHRPDHTGGSDVILAEHHDGPEYQISITTDVVDHYYGVTNMPVENITIGKYGEWSSVYSSNWYQAKGVLQVSGDGAGLDVASHIYLGKEGGDGTLIVNNGGVVRAGRILTGGYYGNSEETEAKGSGTGHILLDGDGTQLYANKIVLGVNSNGWQELKVSNGAYLWAKELIIHSDGEVLDEYIVYNTVFDIENATVRVDHLTLTAGPPDVADFNISNVGPGGTIIARVIDAAYQSSWDRTDNTSSLPFNGGTLYMVDRGWHDTPSTTFNGILTLGGDSTLAFDASMLDDNPDLYVSHGIYPTGSIYTNTDFNIKIIAASDGTVPDLDTAFPIIEIGEGENDIYRADVSLDYQFLTGSLNADGNKVFITLSRNDKTLTSEAVTSNEFAVGSALDAAGADHDIHNALLGLTTNQSARTAFNGLSGEIHASVLTSMIDNGLRSGDIASNRLQRLLTPGIASASGLNVWLANQGGQAKFDAVNSAEKSKTDYFSVAAGLDAAADTGLLLGAALEYSKSYIRVDARRSRADIESIGALLYAGRNMGDYQIMGGAGVSSHQIDSRRFTGLMPLSGPLDGDYSGLSGNIWLDASREVDSGNLTLTPFVRLDQTVSHTSDFTEENNIAALQSSEDTQSSTFTTLGVRGERNIFETPELTTQITGKLGWRHAFGDLTPEQTMRYAIGSNAFSIEGRALDRDVMTVKLGLAARSENGFTLDIGYSGSYGDDSMAHGMMATARFVF